MKRTEKDLWAWHHTGVVTTKSSMLGSLVVGLNNCECNHRKTLRVKLLYGLIDNVSNKWLKNNLIILCCWLYSWFEGLSLAADPHDSLDSSRMIDTGIFKKNKIKSHVTTTSLMSGADTGAAVETMEPYAVFHSFHLDRLGLFSGTVFWVCVCVPVFTDG